MILQDDGTHATTRVRSTVAVAIDAKVVSERKLTKADRARRVKTVMAPVPQPATLWLETCCGQRVSIDQIGSIFGRE